MQGRGKAIQLNVSFLSTVHVRFILGFKKCKEQYFTYRFMRFLAKTIIWEHNWKPELNESPETNKQWWGGQLFQVWVLHSWKITTVQKIKDIILLSFATWFPGKTLRLSCLRMYGHFRDTSRCCLKHISAAVKTDS